MIDNANQQARDAMGVEAAEELEGLAKQVASTEWFLAQAAFGAVTYSVMGKTFEAFLVLAANLIAQGMYVERHGIPKVGE
jgi:hypothetical protein